jgi:hypothetical protein
MVLMYVMGFAIGLGAVQWVVVGEVVPTKIRSKVRHTTHSLNGERHVPRLGQ